MLRKMHQEKVSYFKQCLKKYGIPQLDSKSHIIPIPIGNPYLSNWICNELMLQYGHYVQAINYPTVRKGEERLRIAPSPIHSYEMIDRFIQDFVQVYKRAGLFNIKQNWTSPTCSYCNKLWKIGLDSVPCGMDKKCPLYVSC